VTAAVTGQANDAPAALGIYSYGQLHVAVASTGVITQVYYGHQASPTGAHVGEIASRQYYPGQATWTPWKQLATMDLVSAPGDIKYTAATTPSTGWLKANGAVVSRATYAALFAVIGTAFGAGDGSTTFKLPDLRGEFIRGWSDGRADADAGRALNSVQGDDNKTHVHDYRDRYYNQMASAVTAATYKETLPLNYNNHIGSDDVDSNNTTWLYFDSTTSTSGGTESRPRNIAMLACIKY